MNALPATSSPSPTASTADEGRRPTPNPRDLIASLECGLAVIGAFDQERPRLSTSEVAQRCGLTRTAARRYLITLEHLGFMRSERNTWALSAKVLRLAQSYMHSGRLPRIVQPELHRLAQALKEASSAGVLDGDDVICIAALSAGRMVSSTLQPGTRVPAYCTANGRVLLAALPPAQADAWIDARTFEALTPQTLTHPDRLRAELARVRTQGYAAVDQELEAGLRTLAVPLLGFDGDVLAAINISVHAARMPMEQLIDTGLPALRQTQATLRKML
jgi:IclR family transcriptional regulator, pca regulon regulatory protein